MWVHVNSNMSEDWRLADPDFTDFEPSTVQQAIQRFRRLQRKGLTPWMYPECFIECAAKLPPVELGKFEAWIVNPAGEPSVQVLRDAEEKWEDGAPMEPAEPSEK